jgi:Glyoxalase superfamily protein
MRTHHDAKAMADTLRNEAAARGLKLTHSESLELVAKMFGLKNWNVLAAKIEGRAPTFATLLPVPEGWIVGGTGANLYQSGRLPGDGPPTLAIQRDPAAEVKLADTYCTIMQTVAARDFRGRKVRWAAEINSTDIVGSGTIWLRIDDVAGKTLGFVNLEKPALGGSLKGTSDWVRRVIVLEVPESAASLHFGFYLNGFGRVCARSFNFGIADAAAEMETYVELPAQPANLDLSMTRTSA